MGDKGDRTRMSGTKKLITVATVIVLVAIAGAIAAVVYKYNTRSVSEDTAEDILSAPEAIDFDFEKNAKEDAAKRPDEWYGAYESAGPIDKVADIEIFRQKCPDVYAVIQIPGTDIDYPIAYCEDAVDPFWFTHDIDGNPDEKGMIITDSLNRNDFSDPMTLIYGQAPDDGTMFADLAAFRNADFFEDHDRINIYLEDSQLVYRVFACYIGSNEHILVENDFNDPSEFNAFFDSIDEVRDLSMNIRQDAKPAFTDHVIALVTHCDDDSKRLFVLAVLDEIRY